MNLLQNLQYLRPPPAFCNIQKLIFVQKRTLANCMDKCLLHQGVPYKAENWHDFSDEQHFF